MDYYVRALRADGKILPSPSVVGFDFAPGGRFLYVRLHRLRVALLAG
jgi:hypothetical protein